MAEAKPRHHLATGLDDRTRREQRELSSLLREAARLVEGSELSAASETLKEATVKAGALHGGETQNPGTRV
ncbi:MAG: hypothetical protein WA990_09330 [Rubrobacteraceae bacterium]